MSNTLVFCYLCRADVESCLHFKMEAKLRGKPKPNPLQTMPLEKLWAAYRSVESCLMYESYGSDEEARINDMRERGRYCQELKRRGEWGNKRILLQDSY
jgi:hypothetical protein